MKKLILHIEWGDGIQLSSEELEGYLSVHIGDLFGNLEHEDEDSPDVGWRWFPDLCTAQVWEETGIYPGEEPVTWPINFDRLAYLLEDAGCPSSGHHIARLRALARGERVRLSYHATCRVLIGERPNTR